MYTEQNQRPGMALVPSVVRQEANGERSYDIYSRMLAERIIFFTDQVDDVTASITVAQLLHLEAEDPTKPIKIYINSPGGSISAGLAIWDTMRSIKCPVHTVCIGMAASMGAFLLAGGDKGHRYILPYAEVMIHQPLGGARGQASDVVIQAEHLVKTKTRMNKLMAEFTGQSIETIERDTDRDNWKTAEEALAYGLVDHIIQHRKGIAEVTE